MTTKSYFNDPVSGTLRDNQAAGTIVPATSRDIVEALFDADTVNSVVITKNYSYPTLSAGITIPGTTTSVAVALSNTELLQLNTSTQGSIASIQGLLTRAVGGTYSFTRATVGAALTVSSGEPFITGTSKTDFLTVPVTKVGTTVNLGATDYFSLVSDDTTVNLPVLTTPSIRGIEFTVKKTDSSATTVTVTTTDSSTIDGAANVTLTAQYSRVTVVTDGLAWYVK